MTRLRLLALARHVWPRITACTQLVKVPSSHARLPVATRDGPSAEYIQHEWVPIGTYHIRGYVLEVGYSYEAEAMVIKRMARLKRVA